MTDSDKTVNKAEQAYLEIKNKILMLEFPPEYPLREIDLSEQLCVSRTPIRTAIDRLVSDGFAEEAGSNRNIVSRVSADAFMEIYQLRETLEDLCVSLAVYAWQDSAEIQPLRDILQEQLTMTEYPTIDSRAFLLADRKFHHMLAVLSHSKLLEQEMMRIYDLYWRYIFYSLYKNRSTQIVQEHMDVIDAIERRDSISAQAGMKRHLSRAKDEILLGLARSYNPNTELPSVQAGYSLSTPPVSGS